MSSKLSLSFVHLNAYSHLLEPAGSFSLLLESVGAMRLAYRALSNTEHPLPDVFVDTTGCAFTYLPAVLLFGCRVLAYVHYPTISTDMLQLVWERRRSAYNHQAYITASVVTTYLKLVYYLWFACLYGAVGSLATLVLVNSTWTYNHIHSLWKGAAWRGRIRIVFPPCSLAQDVVSHDDQTSVRQPVVVSIGQFRPEKDHVLQIEAMAKFVECHPELDQAKLVLIGSCRGSSDEARLSQLRDVCTRLHLSPSRVEFVVNRPFTDVLFWLRQASVGIHTVRGLVDQCFLVGLAGLVRSQLSVFSHVHVRRCGMSTLALVSWK
jgi:alpha-1,2-mannosyltransferase